MPDIKKVIKQLIKEGKGIEVSLPVKLCGNTGEYYLPDQELEKIIESNPGFIRAGTDYQKVNGKKAVLIASAPQLKTENEKIKRLLHDLTPGGSEFYNDPEKCAEFIRTSRQENHYALAGQIKGLKSDNESLQARNTELVEALKIAENYVQHFIQNGGIGESENDLTKIKAALDKHTKK